MALTEEDREALRSEDEQLQEQLSALETAARAGALDAQYFDRLSETLKDLVARLKEELLPQLEADLAFEVQSRLLTILTMRPGDREPIDFADELLMEIEAVRHVIRDALQEQPRAFLLDAAAVARQLESWLPRIPQRELAELLGISPRTYQRHRDEGGDSTSREQTVLRLVAILRKGWSDAGVLAWFRRPRTQLGEATPLDLLADPAQEQVLLKLARRGRVQGA